MATSSFTPSPYQAAYFDWLTNGQGSAILIAVAGSGKTTTVLHGFSCLPANCYATYLAFNKKIVTETELKLRETNEDGSPRFPIRAKLKVATFHSVCFNAWRFYKKSVREPDNNKVRDLLDRNFGDDQVRTYGSFAAKMVSLAKNAGVGLLVPNDVATWMSLADHYDVFPDVEGASIDEGIEIARKLLDLSIAAADAVPSHIDFDDMLFMPLIRNVRFFQVDYLFVDEAQDTNSVQLAIMRRIVKPGGRLIAVGDPRQAIYGFRGANSDAMDRIKQAFSCVELPLTVSYRCPQAVGERARRIVPYFEVHESNVQGVVDSVHESDVQWNAEDVIICRNTAPLITMAYTFIRRGVGCKVLGREIGAGLVSLVKKLKASGVDRLIEKLDAYEAREMARFFAKGQEQKADAIKDKCDCIRMVVEGLDEENRTIPAIIQTIEGMFSDDTGKGLLTLCTIHKSKGLEWDHVYVLQPELSPSKYARQDWQIEQEQNLEYVRDTRAKVGLHFLNGQKKQKGGAA